MRDRRLQGIKTIIERQERVPTEGDNRRLLFNRQHGGRWTLGTSWQIGDRTAFLDASVRVALFEAAQSACRQTSPDRDYYRQAAERLGHNRACLAVARKLLKRSYHTLRELGEDALQPA